MRNRIKKIKRLDDMSVVCSFAAALMFFFYVFDEERPVKYLTAALSCQAASSLMTLLRRRACKR